MLKKGHRFCWTDKSETAFEKLKIALTSPPILAMPKDKGLFVLDSDASDLNIGAVLSQLQDWEERVIAYASKVLQAAQQNYCHASRVVFSDHFYPAFSQISVGASMAIEN